MTIETANRLYELRKKNNLSQEELAEKLGVSRQAVSKWERSEASPDTDNLIALAKIYGLSLDELIYGEKSEEANENTTNDQSSCDETASYINIDDDGDKITIGPDGITVKEKDGNTVKINVGGKIMKKIMERVEDSVDEDDDGDSIEIEPKISMDEDGHVHINVQTKKKNSKTRFWLEVPYPIICTIAYLLCGCYDAFGGWGASWIIFVTIPVYYTLVEAIYEKKFSTFAYPVLCAVVYLYFGLYQGNWHPSWIVFTTIAVYYPIANALDRVIRRK